MDTKLVEGSEVRAEGSETRTEGSSKRAGEDLQQESIKKQKDSSMEGKSPDYRVLDWKIYDLCGVHSLRKQNVHIHMLVEKRYPLTPAIIIDMLNKKLQHDRFNEMVSQLLKLLTKQLKNQ
ncbi:hypothetical protein Tco_0016723 [Tanacetum coccineum]